MERRHFGRGRSPEVNTRENENKAEERRSFGKAESGRERGGQTANEEQSLNPKERQSSDAEYKKYNAALTEYPRLLNIEAEDKKRENEISTQISELNKNKQMIEQRRSAVENEKNNFYAGARARAKSRIEHGLAQKNGAISEKQARLEKNAEAEKKSREDQLVKDELAVRQTEIDLIAKKQKSEQLIDQLNLLKKKGYSSNRLDNAVNMIISSRDAQYASSKQREMLAEPVEEFVNRHNIGENFLLNAIKLLPYTVFGQRYINKDFLNDKKFYRKITLFVQLIVFTILLICLGIAAVVGIDTKAGIKFVWIHFALMYTVIFYGISSVISRMRGKMRSSTGMAALIISFVIGLLFGGIASAITSGAANAGGMILVSVIASFAVWPVMGLKQIKNILVGKEFIRTFAYKSLFASADKLEKQAAAENRSVIGTNPQPDQISLMIVCVMRSMAIDNYLSRVDAQNYMAKLDEELKQANQIIAQTDKELKDIDSSKKDLQSRRSNISHKNAETDDQLRKRLNELENEKEVFNSDKIEAAVSNEDRMELTKYNLNIAACVKDIEKCDEELRNKSNELAEAQRHLGETAKLINKAIAELEAYNKDLSNDISVETAGGALFRDICVENANMPAVRPAIVRHDIHPVLFRCKNGDNNSIIEFIYQLWRAFGKRNSDELMKLFLVDQDGVVAERMRSDMKHFDMLGCVRNGFNEGDIHSPELPKNAIHILSESADFKALEGCVKAQMNNIMGYVQENKSRIAADSLNNEMIYAVNSLRKNETGVAVMPYFVTFFIVPQTGTQYMGMLPDAMMQRIARDTGSGYGFIPILIALDGDIHDKWVGLVDSVKRAYDVDLRTTELKGRNS